MTEPADRMPRSFWIGVAFGVLPMAWGARLYLEATPDLSRRLDLVKWIVGLDIAHDLVLAPIVVGLGVAVSRWVPGPARSAVQASLMATGAVLLVGWLPLTGTTMSRGNPTIQPLDYGPSIAAAIAAIWLTAAVVMVARARRHR